MNKSREIVCIVCPNGCRMNVAYDENNEVTLVENASCKKGEEYAVNEIQFPKRSITSTVGVINGVLPLVSVRTDKPIPKEKISAALDEIKKIRLEAPVTFHQIIINDLLGTGAQLISTKEVTKVEKL
ncbi:DUF1667 domain-containing protein [Clostridium sp. BNL1100]|uniref:DUF1667 domain-containing protein n=1 Tax=Clostridium sp. BNL1100 TaxID=755731 RepID=UPI00024A7826|nr:DUF1667 domain-containing protein [Clostridium sp. BNL1100]AEY66528.1 putative protein with conserved CXXC pairs [Clostridium sp. BNL1100]